MIRADSDCRASGVLPWLVAAACLTAAAGEVRAQASGGAQPLHLKVKPSGLDGLSEEARARQERLEARMRRNEFLFRSICRTCSQGDRFESGAPFHPHEALRTPPAPGSADPKE